MGLLQTFHELVAKGSAEDLDWHEVTGMRRDPAGVIRGQTTTGHHAMNMRMSVQGLSPGVQNAKKADLHTATLVVGRYFHESRRGRLEK